MTVSTVEELRRLHVVSSRSDVIHWSGCGNIRRIMRGTLVPIGDDPRYWRGELRAGLCCMPIVPTPDSPEDEPGWKHAATTIRIA